MTLFTINNKDYTHKELNLIRDFFTDDQWNIIDYALDEYKQSGRKFLGWDDTYRCRFATNCITL